MLRLHKTYLALTIVLFITEVFIALFVHDSIIRPYGGDFLVVILLYCLVKSCMNVSVRHAALGVLLFAYLVEALQYVHVIRILGLEQYLLARIIIGTSFAWTDIAAYTLGILFVITVERFI
ncbi:DUF2809 domain-containing protein [Pedobacter sp. BS3]|nr:DUF2809 domain-containing protein [Pedobacter sp. BS3]